MHLNQSKFPRLYGCNFQFNLFFLINIRRKFNFDHDLISILFLLLILNNSKIQFNSGLLQCWAYFFLVGCYKSFCILAHLVSWLFWIIKLLFYNNSNSLVTTIFHLVHNMLIPQSPNNPNKKEIKRKIFTMKLRINISIH